MELKIRFDNTVQVLELDDATTDQLWLTLSLEDEADGAEREKKIQEAWEEQFNKPEYRNWRKHNRHIGYSRAMPGREDMEEDIDGSEPMMSEVRDDRIFRQDEIERDRKAGYEEVCLWVRETLAKKPKWAAAFIAVRIDGMSVNDHAAAIGVKDASIVSKWLKRAEKKLKENYQKRQI